MGTILTSKAAREEHMTKERFVTPYFESQTPVLMEALSKEWSAYEKRSLIGVFYAK